MTDNINAITAANLRAAADLVAQHHELPQPYVTTSSNGSVSLSWYLTLDHVGSGSQKANAAAIVKAIDGGWERAESWDGESMHWTQSRDGLTLLVQVAREQVCERIVTGTETITIPAQPAVPEQTVEREVVEWRCEPLLSEAAAS